MRVAGTLEHVADGIVVRGEVEAPWQAVCSRCLQPVAGEISVHVDELYEPAPLEGETYPLDDDTLDLTPLVRDALLLELPLAPLCTEDCAGICPSCGADRNETQCDCRSDDSDPAVGGAALARTLTLCTLSLDDHGKEHLNGCPEAEDEPVRHPVAQVGEHAAHPAAALAVPELRCVAAAAHRVQQLRLVSRPTGDRRRVTR